MEDLKNQIENRFELISYMNQFHEQGISFDFYIDNSFIVTQEDINKLKLSEHNKTTFEGLEGKKKAIFEINKTKPERQALEAFYSALRKKENAGSIVDFIKSQIDKLNAIDDQIKTEYSFQFKELLAFFEEKLHFKMDYFLDTIISLHCNHSDELQAYIITEAFKANEISHYTIDQFFNGLNKEVKRLKNIIKDYKKQESLKHWDFVVTHRQKGTINKDRQKEANEWAKKVNNFQINLKEISNEKYTGSIDFDDLIFISNSVNTM